MLALALVSNSALHELIEEQLRPTTVKIAWAFQKDDFWDMVPKRPYEAVIADLGSVGSAAPTFVERARRKLPDARIVLLGKDRIDDATAGGPARFLRLPLAEGALARALARPQPAAESGEDPLALITGASAVMHSVRERVRLFAGADSNVLILGESGVGKEMIARAIHAMSPRREGPFVAVNCGAIPSEIVESELFGHVRGSFTGADRDRVGHFELAHSGTIFLDEVGTMKPDHQVKLLRVLQDRSVTPVGSPSPIPVDLRVIAATNADLTKLLETGRFREDLYYRLNVLGITVPPLRERREDIPDLARLFCERFARRNGVRSKVLSPATTERVMSHPWRGNIRELENAVEHAMVVAHGRDVIELLDLPWEIGERRRGVDRSSVRLTPDGIDLSATVSHLEREMILQSLALASGNKSRAAELLHLKRTTFVEKMKRLDLLDAPESREVNA